MIRHPIRHFGRGHLHFITFSCYRRLPLLCSARSKNVVVEVLAQVRERYGFALVGFVVMAEHVHLLIGEPAKGTPSTVVQALKQSVSRRLRRRQRTPARQLRLGFEPANDLPRRFWQLRFYDFRVRALLGARWNLVWSLKKRVETLHFMHINPLKRKLVAHARDWPWSSFSFYSTQKAGLAPIDPVR